MNAPTNRLAALLTPSPKESEQAAISSRQLVQYLTRRKASLRLCGKAEGQKEETIEIPLAAYRMLNEILGEMAKGNAVTFIPVHAELTTQQAAEFLNVSRPFVVQLIEEKQLPCRLVGTHRRIRFQDMLDYKKRIDAARLKTLEQLSELDQKLGLGY